MKKFTIVLFIGVVIVLSGLYVYIYKFSAKDTSGAADTIVELSCDNGYGMTANYHTPDTNGIMTKLTLAVTKDGTTRIYEMVPAMSGSGSKFETADLKYSLWEHQGEFTFATEGTDISVCTEKARF